MNSKVIALVAVSIASVVGIAAFLIFQEGEAQVLSYDGPPKALIIDQLYDEFPNEVFHKMATEYFQTAGYTVDIVTTKDVTVGFFKNLPSMDYKFVVIRTHGADNEDGNEVVLFTGEKYTEEKYIQEQLFGQVKKAAPILEVDYALESNDESNWVIVNDTYRYLSSPVKISSHADNEFFAISPKMIESMNGKFSDTIFLLGGCNTLSNPSMVKALVAKGSSMVLGWDNTIGNLDNDSAMLQFLENHLQKNMDLDENIQDIGLWYKPELMSFPAHLKYFS